MTALQRAMIAKEIGTKLHECAEQISPEDFRSVFFGVITSIIHRVSDDYWNRMTAGPASNKWGQEVTEVTEELITIMDKFRSELTKHADELNTTKALMDKAKLNMN